MIWCTERDGWGHLYLYNSKGDVLKQLTSGPFSVRSVVGIDEAKGNIYFMANGIEKDEDTYYQHLYRVSMDGTRLKLLNSGNFDHRVNMDESNKYFIMFSKKLLKKESNYLNLSIVAKKKIFSKAVDRNFGKRRLKSVLNQAIKKLH